MSDVTENVQSEVQEQEQKQQYILLNKDGKVICVNEIELRILDISEVTIDDLFMYDSCDIEEWKDYMRQFSVFESLDPFAGKLDIDKDLVDATLLPVEVNELSDDNYEIIFG